ncbi:hypothetical protein AB0B28_21660 [Glycomyces sp. NPDC046736]|uniref:hypothetical protein n=1 Tax=Glycomyces sp. NPDC046736 TaxID=3155615 RepID=UPI0033CCC873
MTDRPTPEPGADPAKHPEPEPRIDAATPEADATPEAANGPVADAVAPPEQVPPAGAAFGATPQPEQVSPAEATTEPAPDAIAPPEQVPHTEPAPVAEPSSDPAPEVVPDPHPEPAPELVPEDSTFRPEAPAQVPPAPFAREPHTSVDAVAEPAAPQQVAPEAEPKPIPLEPEPSVPEPPVALEPATDQTLALPPTTKEVEPAPVVSSAPPQPVGVPVPFASPPTERNNGKFTIKLIAGILGPLILVCGVGGAIYAALMTFSNSLTDKVESTAEDFIAEVAEEDWDAAYGMLCGDLRKRPASHYIPEWESWDADGAQIRPVRFEDAVVTVEFADGSTMLLNIEIEQTAETLDTSICGWQDS